MTFPTATRLLSQTASSRQLSAHVSPVLQTLVFLSTMKYTFAELIGETSFARMIKSTWDRPCVLALFAAHILAVNLTGKTVRKPGVCPAWKGEQWMSTEDNKALVRRYIEEVFHHKNLAILDELCVPDVVIHSPIRTVEGLQAYKQFMSMLLAGFSDMQVVTEDQFAEADRSVLRYSEHGTYSGDVRGIAVTARPFQTNGIMIVHHAADGKIVEVWDSPDTMGLMQQLGVVAIPEAAS